MYSFTTTAYMTYISCGMPGVGEMFFLTSSQGHMVVETLFYCFLSPTTWLLPIG
jgi:hypothetical protein